MQFEWSTYVIVYLITSILGTYARYEFIKTYYKIEKSKLKDFFLFTGYYVLISVIYLLLNIPILTLVSNIVILFAIALTYDRDIKKAAFASIQIIGLLLAIEIIIVLSTGYTLVPMQIISENDYNSIFGPVLSSILFYIIVIILRKYGSKKSFTHIPMNYWITIFIIPISSMYFMVTFLGFSVLSPVRIALMATIVLVVNFSIFKVYDLISEYFEKKVEKEVEENLRDAYSMQLELMKTIDENVSSFRHDMNKHIYSLRTLAQSGEIDRIENYLDQIDETTAKVTFANSGNLIVDSIINYEISKLNLEEVEFGIELGFVPESSKLEDYDLTILLSNLLNNAIEALSKLDSNKRLQLHMKFEKGILFLNVENTFDGEIKLNRSKIITSKLNARRHGYGLRNVERVIKKYNGEKVIDYHDNIFKVKVILYI